MLPVRFTAGPHPAGGAPVVTVDGALPHSDAQGLHLAHWPGNRTPDALKRDLSTEIAFAFLDLPQTERTRLLGDAEALTLNHYDTDGVLALFVLTSEEVARQNRDLLVAAAAAGDLHEVRSDRAFRLDAALKALSDPERAPTLARRDGESENARKQRLLEAALALTGELLAGGDARPELWQSDAEALESDRADLAAATFDDLIYMDVGIWTAGTGVQSGRDGAAAFDPGRHAFFGDGRLDRALLLGPGPDGTTARFVIGTWSFFDVVSRKGSPRPDLAALAARLNEREAATGRPSPEDVRWRHQDPRGATPELWFGTPDLPLYVEHAGEALRPSAIPHLEIKREVIDAIRATWPLPDDDDEAEDGEDIFAV